MSGIRGMVFMVVLWTIGWGLGFGGIMEAFVDPDGKIQDVWPTVLAVPGFIGGVIFSGLLALGERGNRFEISLFIYALFGGVSGIVLGLLSIPAGVGDTSPGPMGMICIGTLLGAVAGF